MKKIYDKAPVVYGILLGEVLSIFFILFECFLVAAGISECGVMADSCIRIVFGMIALLLMKKIIYEDKFLKLFTEKLAKRLCYTVFRSSCI